MSPADKMTWSKLEERWASGFEQLLLEEKEAIALWWLQAEAMNGGLDQYFWNSAGDLALYALSGLRSLGMKLTAHAFESALGHFGDAYPTDRTERASVLEAIERKHGPDAFEPASRQITDMPEDFVHEAVLRLVCVYAGRDALYHRAAAYSGLRPL